MIESLTQASIGFVATTELKAGGWFRRWWTAILGVVVLLAGIATYEYSFWSIPRETATYSAPDGALVAFLSPEFLVLQRLGEALVVIGVVVLIATVIVRLARRRTRPIG